MDKKQAWQALQRFYKLKQALEPSFYAKNKRSLNSIEAELMRAYEKAEGDWEEPRYNEKAEKIKEDKEANRVERSKVNRCGFSL